jgi:DNA-binding GntR family transcriptional regulator
MPPQGDEQRVLRYQVVKDLVVAMIADQGLEPGDKLPSSAELAILAGVSQISVRRALDELERAGRITRHQGVGTFVAQPRIVSDPARSGALLTTLGETDATKDMATELLSLKIGMPSATIASALNLTAGQPVWDVVRRRTLAGLPLIVERAVLPLALIPALDDVFLGAGGSLYTYIGEHYGLVDDYEEQYLEVTVPSPDEREWLTLAAREQVVAIKGVSFTAEGTPFDCYQQVYPARRFGFYVSGTRNRRLLESGEGEDWSVTSLAGA